MCEQESGREKLLGFKGPPYTLSDKHTYERIAHMHPHVFILTTVNLNQFSTNRIQFYWNNIYKNRAHTRNAMENSEHTHTLLNICTFSNTTCLYAYISLLLLFKLKCKMMLCRGFPGWRWLGWLLCAPIQHFDSYSSTSLFEHSLDCGNRFIHIYEHWESMCSNIWEKRKRPFIHSHTIILKSMVFYFSAALWAAHFFRYILFGYLRFRYTQIWKW